MDTNNSLVVTRGEGEGRRKKRVKVVKYMATEGDFILGGELNYTHEIYII